jgi:D-alanine-D-alanine ligase
VTRTRRRIAVVLGGRSSEHAISVASAESVIDVLSKAHDVVTVEIARDGTWALGAGARTSLQPTERAMSRVRTRDMAESDTPVRGRASVAGSGVGRP